MSIRWKLLILLLAVAALPAALITIGATRATSNLGRKVGGDVRSTLTHNVADHLTRYIGDQAEIVRRSIEFVELAVRLQARETERLLAGPVPQHDDIYFTEDFRSEYTHPPDLHVSTKFLRVNEGGERVGIRVSNTEPVVRMAPDVDRNAAMDDARRLAALKHLFSRIAESDRFTDILFWQYVGLQNGVFTMYPGHGRYATDYDHRKRQWYQRGRKSEGLVWSAPYIDEPSRRAVLTAMMPIADVEGAVAGVAAVDVMMADLIGTAKPLEFVSAAVRLTTLMPQTTFDPIDPPTVDYAATEPERLGVFVWATSEASETRTSGDRPFEEMWLRSDDSDSYLAMIRDMQSGAHGSRQMDYDGASCIWAYGQVGRAYLVAIVPVAEVTAQATNAENSVLAMTRSQLSMTAYVCGVAALVVIALAFLTSRVVTNPLRQLTTAARLIASGDFEARVPIRSRDELGQLGTTFNDMAPKLQDQVRMRSSLAVAMEVQQNLLPTGPPMIDGLDIAGHSTYCDETGGDYYDFLDVAGLSDSAVAVALGDVTGHGVAAAMLMATARGILRSRCHERGTLGDLLTHLNELLVDDTGGNRFMTMLLLTIETQSHTMRLASAGHDPPWLYDPAKGRFDEHDFGGLPLGVVPDAEYDEMEIEHVTSGQVLLASTDGVWEAQNETGEMFGKQRVQEIIRAHASESAAQISDAIRTAVEEFRGNRSQEDDITFVLVKIL